MPFTKELFEMSMRAINGLNGFITVLLVLLSAQSMAGFSSSTSNGNYVLKMSHYIYIGHQYHCVKNNVPIACDYLQHTEQGNDTHEFTLNRSLLGNNTKIVGSLNFKKSNSGSVYYKCFEITSTGSRTFSESTRECYIPAVSEEPVSDDIEYSCFLQPLTNSQQLEMVIISNDISSDQIHYLCHSQNVNNAEDQCYQADYQNNAYVHPIKINWSAGAKENWLVKLDAHNRNLIEGGEFTLPSQFPTSPISCDGETTLPTPDPTPSPAPTPDPSDTTPLLSWCPVSHYSSAPTGDNGEGYIYGITKDGVLFHNTPSYGYLFGVYNSYFDIKGDTINDRAICLRNSKWGFGWCGLSPTLIERPDGGIYWRYEVQLTPSELNALHEGKLSIEYKVSHWYALHNYNTQCIVNYGLNHSDSGYTSYSSVRGTSSDICLLGGQKGYAVSDGDQPDDLEACSLSETEPSDLLARRPHTLEIHSKDAAIDEAHAHFWVYYSTVASNEDGSIPNSADVSLEDSQATAASVEKLANGTPKKVTLKTSVSNKGTSKVEFKLKSTEWGYLNLHIIPASSDALSLEQDPLYFDSNGVMKQSLVDNSTLLYKATVQPFALNIALTIPNDSPTPKSLKTSADTDEYLIVANAPFSLPITPVAWQQEDDKTSTGTPDGHDNITSDPDTIATILDNTGLEALSDSTKIQVNAFTDKGDNLHLAPMTSCNLDADRQDNWQNTLQTFTQSQLMSTCFTAFTGSTDDSTPYFGHIRFSAEIKKNTFLNINTDIAKSQLRPATPITPYNIIASKTSVESTREQLKREFYFNEPFTFYTQLEAYAWGHNTPLNITENNKTIVTPTTLNWKKQPSALEPLNDISSYLQSNKQIVVSQTFDSKKNDTNTDPLKNGAMKLKVKNSFGQLTIAETDVSLYYGCLYLPDRSGPEDSYLEAPLAIRYWSGSQFKTADFDSSTVFNSANIRHRLVSSGDEALGDNEEEWKSFTWQNKNIGIGDSIVNYANESQSSDNFDIDLKAGKSNQKFTAPGENYTGQFQLSVNLENMPWIQCNGSTEEIANYEFGTYRGHDRVIYWQEVVR